MARLERAAILLVAFMASTTPASADVYLHRTKARAAVEREVGWMFEDMVTTPGSTIDGYSVVLVEDCRHRGRLVVTCGYQFTARDVRCDGVMRVRQLRHSLDVREVAPVDCY